MRAVVQRVSHASVTVDGEPVGSIGAGLVVLVGVTHDDTAANALALARKVHGLRVLPGELALSDVPEAAALVVSQFTLYGDTRRDGARVGRLPRRVHPRSPLVDEVVVNLRQLGTHVETGRFGAHMQVHMINDGPMTLIIDC